MTLNNDKFIQILLEVILEQFNIIKTQKYRLNSLLKESWHNFTPEQFTISYIEVNSTCFFENLSYRIEVLRTLHTAMNETLKSIKTLIDYLYGEYLTPQSMEADFPVEDFFSVMFRTNEILIGSLQQYFILDLTQVPLGYILIAKYKDRMKLTPLSVDQIKKYMDRSNFPIATEEIHSILDVMINRNYIEKTQDSPSSEEKYRFIQNFDLSSQSTQIFQKKIRNLVEWIIGMWRSLYNIRSLDMPIPAEYSHRDFLEETVKRAATQGYLNASNVIENIATYFQLLLDEKDAK